MLAHTALFLLAITGSTLAADCPFGWELSPGYGCYLYTSGQSFTFDEAAAYCEQEGGYIVSTTQISSLVYHTNYKCYSFRPKSGMSFTMFSSQLKPMLPIQSIGLA